MESRAKVKVDLLSRYGTLGASSRLRLFQYSPTLEREGFTVRKRPLLDDDYLRDLYAGRRAIWHLRSAYLGRLRAMRRMSDSDLIWAEKEVLPWVPAWAELASYPRGVPIIADYDDAIFHRYDMHGSILVRGLLGNKIDVIMRASDMVFAGNRYLAARATAAGARRVEIVPTVVDASAYVVGQSSQASCNVIGWIGTPSTWTEYMVPMMPFLSAVAAQAGARIMAVGAGKAAAADPMLDSVPWSEETEVARIQEMDIGVMPLTDTPWARGKCGYKLIQYMACGLPVVASPVGVNAEIVEHGVNGFLASTDAEWHEALTTLLLDPALRQRMGQAGRKKVEAEYSLQVWGPRVATMLHDVAARGRGG